jgi:hypothetical protein
MTVRRVFYGHNQIKKKKPVEEEEAPVVTAPEPVEEEVDDGSLKLTPEEIKNGWTPESLQAYIDGRNVAQSNNILNKPKVRPRMQKSKYNPHKWRR